MSNRKYAAAVLTDGPITVEKKMDSACAIMAELMNVAASEIIRDNPKPNPDDSTSFQAYLDMKFKKMFPELYREYEVIIGTVPDEDKWKLVVGWRKRWHPLREAPYTSFNPFREPENRYGHMPGYIHQLSDLIMPVDINPEPVFRPTSTRTMLEEMQRSLEARLRRFTGYGRIFTGTRQDIQDVIDDAFRAYRGTNMRTYTWEMREEMSAGDLTPNVHIEVTVHFMGGDIGQINIELNLL